MAALIGTVGTFVKGISLTKALAAASLATTAVGGIASSNAISAQGDAANAAAQYQARQLKAQGDAELASSQAAAAEERRQKEQVISRARAVAAASGGGVDIPLLGEIEEEGTYRQGLALWQGKEAAAGRKMQAEAALFDGRQQKSASRLDSRSRLFATGSTLLSDGLSFKDKYW